MKLRESFEWCFDFTLAASEDMAEMRQVELEIYDFMSHLDAEAYWVWWLPIRYKD